MVLRQISRYVYELEELLRNSILVVHYFGHYHFVFAAAVFGLGFLFIIAGIISATFTIAVQRPRLQLLPAIVQLYQHPRYGGEIDKEQRYDE